MAWFGKAYDDFDIAVATGTAVLAAGTKAVADTKVTADSVIELYLDTAGGTVGAPFVKSKTAGTGFTIESTSSTDTSTIGYRILSY